MIRQDGMTFSLPELYERRGVPRETARAAN